MQILKFIITSSSFDAFILVFLFILLTTNIIQKASAETEEKLEKKQLGSALIGRSFFAPNRPLYKRNKFISKNGGFSIDKENNNEIDKMDMDNRGAIESERERESVIVSDNSNCCDSNSCDSNSNDSNSCDSNSCDSNSNYSISNDINSNDINSNSCDSNSNDSISNDINSNSCNDNQQSSSQSQISSLRPPKSNQKIPRVDFQRPWCPGQLLSQIIPHAMNPIYDWTNPFTCQQFADNYGGISVVVGELDGGTFCSAGPNIQTSAYTIVRGLSTNQPIYAQLKIGAQDFAAAAGPILYPQGLVYYISITKEVAKLPQIC